MSGRDGVFLKEDRAAVVVVDERVASGHRIAVYRREGILYRVCESEPRVRWARASLDVWPGTFDL